MLIDFLQGLTPSDFLIRLSNLEVQLVQTNEKVKMRERVIEQLEHEIHAKQRLIKEQGHLIQILEHENRHEKDSINSDSEITVIEKFVTSSTPCYSNSNHNNQCDRLRERFEQALVEREKLELQNEQLLKQWEEALEYVTTRREKAIRVDCTTTTRGRMSGVVKVQKQLQEEIRRNIELKNAQIEMERNRCELFEEQPLPDTTDPLGAHSHFISFSTLLDYHSSLEKDKNHQYAERNRLKKPVKENDVTKKLLQSELDRSLINVSSTDNDVSVHHVTDMVHLNVGGKRYTTLFETLVLSKSSYFLRFLRIDNNTGKKDIADIVRDENRVLGVTPILFDEIEPVNRRVRSSSFIEPNFEVIDSNGAIFINRDGDLFAYVLQFMRDGKRTTLPENPYLLRQLMRESEFFGMNSWNDVLKQQLQQIEKFRNEELRKCGTTHQEFIYFKRASKARLDDLFCLQRN
ncbi:K+ channel tetramerization domain protein [Dictyocaulus viviparus]|uniref:K+ channel tetramerization domain protein n=1 Tax=Dictyocaulus viviparus TaxID=29172 RepID=A0A0D8Y758_DICVI|nr:K+ channel tetramerization domain protein [Dictyocaulus viviparus]